MTLKFALDVITFMFGWTVLIIVFMLCVALFSAVFMNLVEAFIKEDKPKKEEVQPLLGVVAPNREDKTMNINADEFHKMMKND